MNKVMKNTHAYICPLAYDFSGNSNKHIVIFKDSTEGFEWQDNVDGIAETDTQSQKDAVEFVNSISSDKIISQLFDIQKEKLIINMVLFRKEQNFRTKSCIVEKVAVVPHDEFLNLKYRPLDDNDLIAESVDTICCDSNNNYNCLLIYDEEKGDDLLIELRDIITHDILSIFRTYLRCLEAMSLCLRNVKFIGD